jgi:hypothetical protein
MEANNREKGMVRATIKRPDVAQEQNSTSDHQDHAFGQIVQHRVGGEVNQIAAIDEGNDLYARRQNVIVQSP